MKKILLSIVLLALLSGCKSDEKKEADYKDALIDKVKDSRVEQSYRCLDSTESYAALSLNDLVRLYNKDRSNKGVLKAIAGRHIIPRSTYLIMKYAFWKGHSPVYYITYDRDKITEITGYSHDYICFNPSEDPKASDIQYTRIMTSDWDRTTGCYPVGMFREILEHMTSETDTVKLLKGYNYIQMEDGSHEKHVTVLLEVLLADGSSICYDISHDPGT